MVVLALEGFGQALGLVLLIGLAIILSMVLIAVAVVLTGLRRSLSGTLIALVVGLGCSIPLWMMVEEPFVGLIGGGLGGILAFLVDMHIRGPADPVRILHHRVVTAIVGLSSLGALTAMLVVWFILIGIGGVEVVDSLRSTPLAAGVLITITMVSGLLTVSAFSELRR